MLRVVHFEVTADNPARAKKFYEDVFGWQITKWEGGNEDYWLIATGEESGKGIDGGLMKRKNPSERIINTIDVPSVDKFAEKVKESGGEIIVPKTAIPGVGYLVYFRDPEGNVFGMMEDDSSAH